MKDIEQEYIENLNSEDRDQLIDEILLQYIKQSTAKSRENNKISFFIGGGSASGKSNFRKNLLRLDSDILLIDSDDLKEFIPEYSDLVKNVPGVAASIVHKESSLMATKLLYKAIEEKISMIFDGTLKTPEKYKRFIEVLREAGFKVSLVIVDVPVKIALERNRVRFLEQKQEGKQSRLVPDQIVELSHAKIPEAFETLKGLVDEWMIIDTRGDEDKVIANGSEGKEYIIHPKIYEEFLNKGSEMR